MSERNQGSFSLLGQNTSATLADFQQQGRPLFEGKTFADIGRDDRLTSYFMSQLDPDGSKFGGDIEKAKTSFLNETTADKNSILWSLGGWLSSKTESDQQRTKENLLARLYESAPDRFTLGKLISGDWDEGFRDSVVAALKGGVIQDLPLNILLAPLSFGGKAAQAVGTKIIGSELGERAIGELASKGFTQATESAITREAITQGIKQGAIREGALNAGLGALGGVAEAETLENRGLGEQSSLMAAVQGALFGGAVGAGFGAAGGAMTGRGIARDLLGTTPSADGAINPGRLVETKIERDAAAGAAEAAERAATQERLTAEQVARQQIDQQDKLDSLTGTLRGLNEIGGELPIMKGLTPRTVDSFFTTVDAMAAADPANLRRLSEVAAEKGKLEEAGRLNRQALAVEQFQRAVAEADETSPASLKVDAERIMQAAQWFNDDFRLMRENDLNPEVAAARTQQAVKNIRDRAARRSGKPAESAPAASPAPAPAPAAADATAAPAAPAAAPAPSASPAAASPEVAAVEDPAASPAQVDAVERFTQLRDKYDLAPEAVTKARDLLVSSNFKPSKEIAEQIIDTLVPGLRTTNRDDAIDLYRAMREIAQRVPKAMPPSEATAAPAPAAAGKPKAAAPAPAPVAPAQNTQSMVEQIESGIAVDRDAALETFGVNNPVDPASVATLRDDADIGPLLTGLTDQMIEQVNTGPGRAVVRELIERNARSLRDTVIIESFAKSLPDPFDYAFVSKLVDGLPGMSAQVATEVKETYRRMALRALSTEVSRIGTWEGARLRYGAVIDDLLSNADLTLDRAAAPQKFKPVSLDLKKIVDELGLDGDEKRVARRAVADYWRMIRRSPLASRPEIANQVVSDYVKRITAEARAQKVLGPEVAKSGMLESRRVTFGVDDIGSLNGFVEGAMFGNPIVHRFNAEDGSARFALISGRMQVDRVELDRMRSRVAALESAIAKEIENGAKPESPAIKAMTERLEQFKASLKLREDTRTDGVQGAVRGAGRDPSVPRNRVYGAAKAVRREVQRAETLRREGVRVAGEGGVEKLNMLIEGRFSKLIDLMNAEAIPEGQPGHMPAAKVAEQVEILGSAYTKIDGLALKPFSPEELQAARDFARAAREEEATKRAMREELRDLLTDSNGNVINMQSVLAEMLTRHNEIIAKQGEKLTRFASKLVNPAKKATDKAAKQAAESAELDGPKVVTISVGGKKLEVMEDIVRFGPKDESGVAKVFIGEAEVGTVTEEPIMRENGKQGGTTFRYQISGMDSFTNLRGASGLLDHRRFMKVHGQTVAAAAKGGVSARRTAKIGDVVPLDASRLKQAEEALAQLKGRQVSEADLDTPLADLMRGVDTNLEYMLIRHEGGPGVKKANGEDRRFVSIPQDGSATTLRDLIGDQVVMGGQFIVGKVPRFTEVTSKKTGKKFFGQTISQPVEQINAVFTPLGADTKRTEFTLAANQAKSATLETAPFILKARNRPVSLEDIRTSGIVERVTTADGSQKELPLFQIYKNFTDLSFGAKWDDIGDLQSYDRHMALLNEYADVVQRNMPNGVSLDATTRSKSMEMLRQSMKGFAEEDIDAAVEILGKISGVRGTEFGLPKFNAAADIPGSGNYALNLSGGKRGKNLITLRSADVASGGVGLESRKLPGHMVVTHEVAHWAYTNLLSPKEQAEFMGLLRDRIFDDSGKLSAERIDAMSRTMANVGNNTSQRGLVNELFADMFTDYVVGNRVRESQGLFDRLAQRMANLVQTILAWVRGYTPDDEFVELFKRVMPEEPDLPRYRDGVVKHAETDVTLRDGSNLLDGYEDGKVALGLVKSGHELESRRGRLAQLISDPSATQGDLVQELRSAGAYLFTRAYGRKANAADGTRHYHTLSAGMIKRALLNKENKIKANELFGVGENTGELMEAYGHLLNGKVTEDASGFTSFADALDAGDPVAIELVDSRLTAEQAAELKDSILEKARILDQMARDNAALPNGEKMTAAKAEELKKALRDQAERMMQGVDTTMAAAQATGFDATRKQEATIKLAQKLSDLYYDAASSIYTQVRDMGFEPVPNVGSSGLMGRKPAAPKLPDAPKKSAIEEALSAREGELEPAQRTALAQRLIDEQAEKIVPDAVQVELLDGVTELSELRKELDIGLQTGDEQTIREALYLIATLHGKQAVQAPIKIGDSGVVAAIEREVLARGGDSMPLGMPDAASQSLQEFASRITHRDPDNRLVNETLAYRLANVLDLKELTNGDISRLTGVDLGKYEPDAPYSNETDAFKRLINDLRGIGENFTNPARDPKVGINSILDMLVNYEVAQRPGRISVNENLRRVVLDVAFNKPIAENIKTAPWFSEAKALADSIVDRASYVTTGTIFSAKKDPSLVRFVAQGNLVKTADGLSLGKHSTVPNEYGDAYRRSVASQFMADERLVQEVAEMIGARPDSADPNTLSASIRFINDSLPETGGLTDGPFGQGRYVFGSPSDEGAASTLRPVFLRDSQVLRLSQNAPENVITSLRGIGSALVSQNKKVGSEALASISAAIKAQDSESLVLIMRNVFGEEAFDEAAVAKGFRAIEAEGQIMVMRGVELLSVPEVLRDARMQASNTRYQAEMPMLSAEIATTEANGLPVSTSSVAHRALGAGMSAKMARVVSHLRAGSFATKPPAPKDMLEFASFSRPVQLRENSRRMRFVGARWAADFIKPVEGRSLDDARQVAISRKLMPIVQALDEVNGRDNSFKAWAADTKNHAMAAVTGQARGTPAEERIYLATRRGDLSKLSTEERNTALKIQEMFRKSLEDQKAAGLPAHDITGGGTTYYVPQRFNTQWIDANYEEAVTLMKRWMMDQGREEADAQGAARTTINRLLDDADTNGIIAPGSSFLESMGLSPARQRTFRFSDADFQNPKYGLDKLMDQNIRSLAVEYHRAMETRILMSKQFGVNLHGIDTYLDIATRGEIAAVDSLLRGKSATLTKSGDVAFTGDLFSSLTTSEADARQLVSDISKSFVDLGGNNIEAAVDAGVAMLVKAYEATGQSGRVEFERHARAVVNGLADFGSRGRGLAGSEIDFIKTTLLAHAGKPVHMLTGSGSRDVQKVTSTMLTVNAVTLLSMATLSSLPDMSMSLIRGGSFKAWANGGYTALKMVSGFDPESRKSVRSIGTALESIINENVSMVHGGRMASVGNTFFNAIGLTPWTNAMRDFAAVTGFENIRQWQAIAQRERGTDSSKFRLAMRRLRELGVAHLANAEPLTDIAALRNDDILAEAVHKFVQESVFQPGKNDIPTKFQDPLGKLVWQFKSYPIMLGRMVRKAFNEATYFEGADGMRVGTRNLLTKEGRESLSKTKYSGSIKPLLYLGTVGVALGMGAQAVRDIVAGRNEEGDDPRSIRDRTLSRIVQNFGHKDFQMDDENADRFMGWYLEGLMGLGALGLVADMFYQSAEKADNGAYGEQRIASLIAGPTLGTMFDVIGIGSGAVDAVLGADYEDGGSNAPERRAIRALAGRIPVFGSTMRPQINESIDEYLPTQQ